MGIKLDFSKGPVVLTKGLFTLVVDEEDFEDDDGGMIVASLILCGKQVSGPFTVCKIKDWDWSDIEEHLQDVLVELSSSLLQILSEVRS